MSETGRTEDGLIAMARAHLQTERCRNQTEPPPGSAVNRNSVPSNGVVGQTSEYTLPTRRCETCMHHTEPREAPVCLACSDYDNWEQANAGLDGRRKSS